MEEPEIAQEVRDISIALGRLRLRVSAVEEQVSPKEDQIEPDEISVDCGPVAGAVSDLLGRVAKAIQ